MHKSISILATGVYLCTVATASAQQLPKFEWAKQTARGVGYEESWDVTTDASGNVLSTGGITGATDFDPGAGTFEITPATATSVFISKLEANGNFLWAKTIDEGGNGFGIVTDASGNVYVTGYYGNTADFDPGPGVFNLPSNGTDMFILKLDADGNFVWAKHYDTDYGNSIALDAAGFIYVAASGSFSSRAYVIKLDTDGNEIWIRNLSTSSGAYAVSIGASGNVVVSGTFTGAPDFDPGVGVYNLTATGSDLFIWKLNGNGDFVWAKQLDATGMDIYKSSTSLDAAENIYIANTFSTGMDADPGPGTFPLITPGSQFICKLNSNGDFVWAKTSTVTEINFIATDAAGNSYMTGEFNGTRDFDPGAGIFNLTSAGNQDTFILKLDASGNFVWATRTGSLSTDIGSALHADANGNIFLTSYFYQTADFDPTCGNTTLIASANRDTYVQKLSSVTPPVIASFSPANGTTGTVVTISGSGFSTTPANNIVRFTGVIATVTASTATSLTVTAPSGIATGKISVTVGCNGVLSATNFVLPSCIEKLFDFTGTANGEEPWGSLITDGTFLYGMTESGGANDMGAVFKIGKDGTGYTTLLDFSGVATGSYPKGSLIYDGIFLYGTAYQGGANNLGTLFKIKPDGTGFVKLLDFDGTANGGRPHGSLVSDGSFHYGMTYVGGTNNLGTIFKIMPDGTGYVKLLDFAGVASGSNPMGSLIYDGSFLYGMASAGGTVGRGTLFKIKPDGTGFVKMLNFTSSIGSDPYGDLVSDGTFLYGMTSGGGTIGDGVIFKIRSDGTNFTRLLNFNGATNGDSPFASLIINGSTLYGMTYRSVGNGFGTIFRINTNGTGHTILCNMPTEEDGGYPSGSLILDGGVLYGMTQLGGTSYMGSIFKYAIGGGKPTIASFAPTSGPIGTTVTITGTNYDAVAANNIVYFGAVKAVVTASTTTQLSVTVPAGATYQPITILVNGLTAFSSKPFTVTFVDGGIIDACAFASNVDITPGVSPYMAAIADLDSDGKPDLAITNTGENTISIFKNISTTGTITATSFEPKVDFTTGDSPQGIFIKDLDGDGKPEIGVANNNSSTISIFRNTTTGGTINTSSFATKVDFATGSQPHDIAIHDFDGDGKPDLAVTNRFSTTVSVLKNTSFTGTITTSSFAPKVDFATGSGPQGIASLDIDGDGKVDLVIADEGASSISVLRNTASTGILDLSSFAAKVDFAVGPNPTTVAIADLDGDGKNDVAVSNADNGTVSVLRNISTAGTIDAGSFSAAEDFFSNGGYAVEIDDIDGDGKPDLITNSYPNGISVLKNQSSVGAITSSSFATAVEFAITPNIEGGLAIGDLDGNGKPDIIASGGNDPASILRNTVSGLPMFTATGFSPASGPVGGAVTITGTNFSSTPLNNTVKFNGTVAEVTASTSTSITAIVPSGATTGSISLEIGCNQAFTVLPFTITATLPPTITSFTPTSGPIDETVIITGTNFSTTPLGNIVFFGATQATVNASTATQLTVTVPTGATYAPITVLNVATELLAYSMSNFTPTFSPNKGSITATDFDPKIDFATGTNPLSVSIGDLDGDGMADLAVANTVSNTVSVFRNTSTAGNISYEAKVDYLTEDDPQHVAIGDLDGDGKPDLAVATHSGFSISLFRNTSTGPGNISYAPRVDIFSGITLRSLFIGDLDSDGKSDLVVTNYNGNSISVFRNTSTGIGDISYAASIDYTIGGTSSPRSVSIGDLDGDAKPDLAVANFGINTVSVFRNNSTVGNISYEPNVDFAAGTSPNSIAMGDFDGDGKSDLATVNLNSPSISILMNTTTGAGNISFASKIDYATTGPSPRSVSIGDLDGDEKPDLAVTNFTSGSVSIFRNTSVGAGNIGFAVNVDYTTGSHPLFAAIGDLDSDGKADMAVANQGDNTVSVIRNNPVFSTLIISGFAPSSGTIGTTVIITGTDFSPTSVDNIVEFNGVAAIVTASTTTSITTTVPAGATTGPITITVGGNTGTSATNFTVTSPDITVNTQPSSSSVCTSVNATFTTDATGTTNITYQWQFSLASTGTFNDIANGNNYSNTTTATLTVNTTGNFGAGFYRCRINGDLAATEFTNEASLSIQPIPTAPTTTSASRCGDGTLTLNASGGVDGQYKWYTVPTAGTAIAGAVNSVYTTSSLSATTQFFVASVNGSCESDRTQATATITSLSSSPTVTGGSTCPGSPLTLNASGGSNGQFKWYTDAIINAPLTGEVNNTYTPPTLTQTTTYFVTVTTNGCESLRTPVVATVITSGCAPEIEVAELRTIVEGTIVIDLKPLITTVGVLDVSSIKVITGPGSGAITTIENGILTIIYTGVNFGGSESITVEACNTNGLCGSQNFTIEVHGDIIIYNAVSPNDDGKNEIFILEYIDALPSTKNNKVSIFNRWGDEVFSISDYDNKTRAFSGRNKDGNKLPSGTYYYKIYFPQQDKTVTGFLSVKY